MFCYVLYNPEARRLFEVEDEPNSPSLYPDQFKALAKKNPTAFPEGPARVLLEEGQMPFIQVFFVAAEEGSEVVGLHFANDQEQNETVPNQIVAKVINFQDLGEFEDGELDLDFCIQFYQNMQNIYGVPCIQQYFCQTYPGWDDTVGNWTNWTQVLRAAWLKAHKIAPFDGSIQGKANWKRVMHVVQNMKSASNPEEDGDEGNQENTNANPMEDFEALATQCEPYSHSHRWSEAPDVPYANNMIASFALHYLRQEYDLAKAMNYNIG